MDYNSLTPEQQAIMAQLFSQSQNMTPASGPNPLMPGAPVTPEQMSTPAPAPEQAVAPQQPAADMTDMPAPGSFANDPEGAMKFIAQKLTGPKLARSKEGQLSARVPVDQPLLKLFGMKKNVPVGPNYYDSLVGTYGEELINTMMPGETPLTPEGKPYVGADMLGKLEGLLPKSKSNPNDQPNKALGNAMLAKVGKVHGEDSPIYQNLKEAITGMGGLAPSKMGEINAALGTPTKENDFVQDKVSGLMLRFNRATETYEPVPGQSVGLASALQTPTNREIFNRSIARFDADPVVKESKKALDLLGNVSQILESDNPAAIGILFSNIAKSIGKEAGVLTEGDIARAVGDPGYAAQLHRWYSKRIDFIRDPKKGKLSEQDLKDFRGLFRDIAKGTTERYNRSLDKHRKSLKTQIPEMTDEFIDSAMDTVAEFKEAPARRLPGEATNHPTTPKPGAIATADDYLAKRNKGKK